MIGLGTLLKLGIPGAAGFLLGLLALAVIQPRTAEGKALLLITAVCLVLVASFVVGGLVRLIRGSGRSAEKDEAGEA